MISRVSRSGDRAARVPRAAGCPMAPAHLGVRWLATALAAPNRPNAQSSAFAAYGYRRNQSGGKPPHSKMPLICPVSRPEMRAAPRAA